MKAYRWFLIAILGISLAACSVNEPNVSEEDVVCEECEVCEVCQINPFPEGLVLPQIYIQGKLYWTTTDLDALTSNIIDPIIAYYDAENQTVVSILVTTDDLAESSINTIIVEVIVSDNDGNQEPLYMGILIEKVSGVFPVWEPETINP